MTEKFDAQAIYEKINEILNKRIHDSINYYLASRDAEAASSALQQHKKSHGTRISEIDSMIDFLMTEQWRDGMDAMENIRNDINWHTETIKKVALYEAKVNRHVRHICCTLCRRNYQQKPCPYKDGDILCILSSDTRNFFQYRYTKEDFE